MKQFHFPTSEVQDVNVTGFGHTDDGYEAVVLTGDIAVTTDNLLGLASFFTGLGAIISRYVVERDGLDAVIAELESLRGGEPFPEPEAEQQRLFSVVPDVEGRDL